jgi:general stress protein YciG
MTTKEGTSHRGFAAMDPRRQKEIASAGGRAAHEKGTAHEFSSEEARNAGRKGGLAVSQNREHMARIGREGGKARGQRARQQEHREEPPRTEAGPAPAQTPGREEEAA